MKKTILIVILLAITYVSNSQKLRESDVPAAVKTAFAVMYPEAEQVEWEKESGKYEGEFKINNIESSALFEASGIYIQTETEMPVLSLPDAAREYISKNLPGEKIKEAAKITDAKGGITYEAEVGESDFLFDSSGVFISRSTEEKDKEDHK